MSRKQDTFKKLLAYSDKKVQHQGLELNLAQQACEQAQVCLDRMKVYQTHYEQEWSSVKGMMAIHWQQRALLISYFKTMIDLKEKEYELLIEKKTKVIQCFQACVREQKGIGQLLNKINQAVKQEDKRKEQADLDEIASSRSKGFTRS